MPSHSATPNWQTPMPLYPSTPSWQTPMPQYGSSHHRDVGLFNPNLMNRERKEAYPSIYLQSPFTRFPPTTVLPNKLGDRSRNKGTNANVSPFNLGNAIFDDSVHAEEVMITGVCQTDNYIVYKNVDPSKLIVKRERYTLCMQFLLNPYPVYLVCHIMGYSVPELFWRELVPNLYMGGYHELGESNTEGWLSMDQMNAWIELLIRERPQGARWIVAKLGTASLHPHSNQFIIQMDPHLIGTLDGSTCPYPSWNEVDWVYMPINARGDHWVTGAVNLLNSRFYVFDSLHSEVRRRQPYNFQVIYNDGLGCPIPQLANFKDCGVITCWLISKLCVGEPIRVNGLSQEFRDNVRTQMLHMFYNCRCEDTRNCGYD
ncbi:phospholipase-like protein [Tanacetum coccineum]